MLEILQSSLNDLKPEHDAFSCEFVRDSYRFESSIENRYQSFLNKKPKKKKIKRTLKYTRLMRQGKRKRIESRGEVNIKKKGNVHGKVKE